MTTITELRRLMGEALDGAKHRGRRKMLTGRRTGAGVTEVTLSGADTNKVWVRSAESSRELTQAWGYCGAVNIWVWVELDPTGDLRVVGPVYQDSTPTAGAALGAVTTPPLVGEAAAVFISGRQFLPGLLHASTAGGLAVTVEAFHYDDGYFPGGDLTLTAPGTAGKVAWCAVVLDPATGALTQVTGTEYDALAGVTETALPTDVSVPVGHIPVGAVVLTNGQTNITSADRFVDFRYHFGGRGGFTLAGDTGTSTIAPADTLTVAGSAGIDTAVSGDTVTVSLDIAELTADATPDAAADYVLTYDASAAAHKKVLLEDLPGGGTGGGHTIEDEGTPVTQRDTLNFVGAGVSVADEGGKTVVTIPGGSTGGLPIEDTGDLITSNDAPTENASQTGIVNIGSGATETIIGDLDVTRAGTDGLNVFYDFWWSMNQYGVHKIVRVRLRRTNTAGEILYEQSLEATIDNSAGHERRHTGTYVDNAPTDGRYVLTFQRTSGGVDVFSDTRILRLTPINMSLQRIPIGSTGQYLRVSGGLPAWQNGPTIIQQTVLGANTATVSFTSIPTTYTNLRLEIQARCDNASAQSGFVRFNADSGTNYDRQSLVASGSTQSASEAFASTSIFIGEFTPTGATSGATSSAIIDIPNYANTSWWKDVIVNSKALTSVGAGGMQRIMSAGEWRSTSAINRIDAILATGNWIQGSIFTLWGLS